MNRVVEKIALISFLTLPFGFVAGFAQSQDRPDPRIRLAQTYERSGRLEEAARLYEELVQSDPGNVIFLDGLGRIYVELKRYDEAVALARSRLERAPGDVSLRTEIGSILYKAGREKEAFAEWEGAIAADSTNPANYRIVAGSLMENRLLERTTEIYRRARVNCGDQSLFTIELAQLLGASMDYSGATREYLRWLNVNPTQLSFVQSRMSNITSKPDGRAAAVEEVRQSLLGSESLPFLELLGWLHLEGKEYRQAYTIYREIDAFSEAKGERIYQFAEQAFQEGRYDVASDAFREAAEIPVRETQLPAARFGYASCLKEMGALMDGTEPDPSQEAIAAFNQIIVDYPASEFSARSYLQIGDIYFRRFFDLDRAQSAYEAAEAELPARGSVYFNVLLRLGEVSTASGDTTAASERFRIVTTSPQAIPDKQDEATFRIAELEYFGGKFQSSIDLLNGLTLNLTVNYANDALKLLSFLRENNAAPGTALLEFATADFLGRQGKFGEAVPVYLRIADAYPTALLADEALLNAGRLLAETGNYEEAIATYRRLLDEKGETSIALDDAQFTIGLIYDHQLADHVRAIETYEGLLARFPRSLHATEARKRIRELRGESL